MQRQFLFLFFNYVSKVSFSEPSCRIRFVEFASLNLVLERFVALSFFFFFDIEIFKYAFILPHTIESRVTFNITQIVFHNIHEIFALYQGVNCFNLFTCKPS